MAEGASAVPWGPVIGLALAVGVAVAARWTRRRAAEAQRRVIEETFRARLAGLEGVGEGVAAELVRAIEHPVRVGGWRLQVQRLHRLADGRYLLFICTSGEPGYLRWLTDEEAARAVR